MIKGNSKKGMRFSQEALLSPVFVESGNVGRGIIDRFFNNLDYVFRRRGLTVMSFCKSMNEKHAISLKWDTFIKLRSGRTKTCSLTYLTLLAKCLDLDIIELIAKDFSKEGQPQIDSVCLPDPFCSSQVV